MARSMYLEPYLDCVDGGRLVTPGTFLSQTLQGKAKSYMGHYYFALMRALDEEILAGHVLPIVSVGKSTAFKRIKSEVER